MSCFDLRGAHRLRWDAAMPAARRFLLFALMALLVPLVEGRQRGDRPGELRLVS
jgi:hypothetical protein